MPIHWILPKWSLPKLFVWLKERSVCRFRPLFCHPENAPEEKHISKWLLGTSQWLESWVMVVMMMFKLSPAVVFFSSISITIYHHTQLCQSKSPKSGCTSKEVHQEKQEHSAMMPSESWWFHPCCLLSKEKYIIHEHPLSLSWSHGKIVSTSHRIACRCLVASHQQQGAPNIIRGSNGCSQTDRPGFDRISSKNWAASKKMANSCFKMS